MITLYGIKTCGSVKKAITLLNKHDVPYTFIDVKIIPLDSALLIQWTAKKGIAAVLNTKGATYKKLKQNGIIPPLLYADSINTLDSIESQAFIESQKACVEMITRYPLLLKRPVIMYEKMLIIGYDEAEILALIHDFQHKKL